MRETRQSGSEGGGAHALPTPMLVDYKSRYKRGTCTSRNVIRSLPLPVPYLSTHVASLCSRPHALNGLCIAVAAGRYRSRFRICRPTLSALTVARAL
jgi:hypothetical protein